MKVRAFVLLACVLLPVSVLAAQDLVDQEWVLPSGGSPQSVAFTLSGTVPVSVDMAPVKHADKGVTIRIVPTADFAACAGKAQGQCRSRPGFDGFKVRSFSHTEPIPAGNWTFYAANTENMMFSATIHVHLVVNP
jgi:hypothetical protein